METSDGHTHDHKGMTGVYCSRHGYKHYFTPTALALVVMAYQDNEGHVMSGSEVIALCPITIIEGIGMEDPRRSHNRGQVAWRETK